MELSRVNVIVRTNLKHFKVGKKKILKSKEQAIEEKDCSQV